MVRWAIRAYVCPVKGDVWISRRQLRWLLVLLALLPLVPTVLMVRQMIDVAQRERDAAVAEVNGVYRDQLARYVDRYSRAQLAEQESIPQDLHGQAMRLADYVEKMFGEEIPIRVTSPRRRIKEQRGQGMDWNVIAVEIPRGVFTGWKVEVAGMAELPAGIDEGVRESFRRAGFLVLMVAVVAGLVYWVISRRIRVDVLKADLMATVSHEMKTPLASMRVLLETLADGAVEKSEQRAEYLAILMKENRRLARLVEQFLTTGRLDRGEVTLQTQPLDVPAICESAAAVLMPTMEERKMSVEICPSAKESSHDLFALGHADSLSAVLVNLVDNAVKYGPEGSTISIVVKTSDPDRMLIEVRDKGELLTRQEGQRVFERFYQADDRLDRKGGGVGLGLSISRQLVELMGGSIGWRATKDSDEDGGGTSGNVFYVELLACSAPQIEQTIGESKEEGSKQHG